MSRDLADMAGRVMELVRLNLALLARVAELEAELALRDAAGAGPETVPHRSTAYDC